MRKENIERQRVRERETGIQGDIQIQRHTDIQTKRHTDIQTEIQKNRETQRHTDRETEKQRRRDRGRHRKRQRDRERQREIDNEIDPNFTVYNTYHKSKHLEQDKCSNILFLLFEDICYMPQ